MVVVTTESHHDEVNLHRLLRRLEKSVQIPGEWEAESDNNKSKVRLRAQKDLQKVKYARKLVQNVELASTSGDFGHVPESPLDYGVGYNMNMDFVGGYSVQPQNRSVKNERVQELNELKIRLDRVEGFLKEQVQRNTEPLQRPPSILAKLPKPSPTPSMVEEAPVASEEFNLVVDEPKTTSPATKRPPPILEAADNLLLSPPEIEDIVSAGLVSAGHLEPTSDSPPPTSYQPTFFRPTAGGVTSSTSAVHASGSSATARKPFGARAAQGQVGHSSLHEELSNQLEVMASQLKRNAIYFAENLAKDKAVVEDAGQKLEQNHDVMQKEKGRLATLNKLTGSTTWMTLGIILVVLLLFIVMIGVIRFSRK